MSDKSDFHKDRIVNLLRAVNITAPVSVFVALSTTSINDDGSGITEPVGNAYARTAVVFDAPALGISVNQLVTFPQATGSWGTLTDFALFDASTGGNMLYHDTLTAPLAVGNLDTARFQPGDLTVSEQ